MTDRPTEPPERTVTPAELEDERARIARAQAAPRTDRGGWIPGPSVTDWPGEARRILARPQPQAGDQLAMHARQLRIIVERLTEAPADPGGTVRNSVAATAVDLAAVLGRLENGTIVRADAALVLARLGAELHEAAAMCGGQP